MPNTTPEKALEETFVKFWMTWSSRPGGKDTLDILKPFFHPDVSSIGTGSHEKGRNLSEVLGNFESDFSEVSADLGLEFEYINSKVIKSDIGVVEAEGFITFEVEEGEMHKLELRFTTTFTYENDQWLVINNHLSVPYLGQENGSSFPLDKLRAQNQQLKKAVEEKTKRLRERSEALRQQVKRTEDLLFNILPVSVAREMLDSGKTLPRKFDNVSVMFTDFVNFTETTKTFRPIELIDELNEIFLEFDSICRSEGLEKIKTIGDSYMAACGLPEVNSYHARRCVEAARRMQDFLAYRNDFNDRQWMMRVGVHSGPVVAGVIGKNKFAYDLWGDTVNIASRLESKCEPGLVNISKNTFELIQDYHQCEPRGEVEVKGGRLIHMYSILA